MVSSLDETTGQYFSEWAGTERENITIRHLMTLRTGLEADCLGPPNDYDNGGNSIYFSLDQVACALNRELKVQLAKNYMVTQILMSCLQERS